jgi:hypothetical protein
LGIANLVEKYFFSYDTDFSKKRKMDKNLADKVKE